MLCDLHPVIYLNHAASAWPKAPGVVETVRASLDSPPFHPGRSIGHGSDVAQRCRTLLASTLRVADPARIALLPSATIALNVAILGVGLGRGSRVVTTVTEHNSVLRPLRHLKERSSVEVAFVGLDDEGLIDLRAFDHELALGADLVVVNHVSNVTGRPNYPAILFRRAKRAGAVTLLDASQSIGHIDVYPEDMDADLVAFATHKGLRGPEGIAGLYVSPRMELDQIIVGGTGVRSDLEFHPADMPSRLEVGTPNVPATAGLVAALEWREEHGPEFAENAARLAEALHRELSAIPGLRIFADEAGPNGVISILIDGWDVEEAGFVLAESFGIVCRTGLHCAPLIHRALGTAPRGTIRLSVSGSNTRDEIVATAQAVRSLADCVSPTSEQLKIA